MTIKIVRVASAFAVGLGLSGCALTPAATQPTTSAALATATPLGVSGELGGTPDAGIVAQRVGGNDLQQPSTNDSINVRPTSTAVGRTTPAVLTPQDTATATVVPTPQDTATASATVRPTGTATVVPTPVIVAPIHLTEAEIGGGKLQPHYWTNTPAIVFSLGAAPGTSPGLRPQVEVEPLARPYTGKPTAEGAPLAPDRPGSGYHPGTGLPEGGYHWQARLGDDQGHAGPWTDISRGRPSGWIAHRLRPRW